MAHVSAPLLSVDLLTRDNPKELLESLTTLRFVDVKLTGSFALQQDLSGDLADALRTVAHASKGDTVSVRLRARRQSSDGLGTSVKTYVKKLISGPDFRESVRTLQVSGDTDDAERRTFDLVRDRLMYQATMISLGGRTRAVDHTSAYDEITKAHKARKDEIESAYAIAVHAK